MTNTVYKQIKQHIKDGLIKTACVLLKQQQRDERYTECYCHLLMMALQFAQSVGPFEYYTYLEIISLTFPHVKGGVHNE